MKKDISRITAELSEPFPYESVEWRISRSGIKSNGEPWAKCLAYIDNRAVQQRLDDVLGIDGWSNEYRDAPGGGILCGITLHLPERTLTKWDGAAQTAVESVKGGLSGSMKRAAVMLGVGRYLYSMPEEFATCSDSNKLAFQAKFKGKNGTEIWGSWQPPKMPIWALPNGQMDRFFDLVSAGDAYNYFLLTRELDEETLSELFNKFPKGEKTSRKNECRVLEKEGAEQFNATLDLILLHVEKEESMAVFEIWDELTEQEKRLMWPQLDNVHDFIKDAVKEARE